MTTAVQQIKAAREHLKVAEAPSGVMGTLGAAALAATAAVLLAGVMILGPGVAIEDPAPVTRADL
ncbi:MAG: peptidoglycan-binding protein [Brevundimonas sp.]|uniref:peptidoglycan-binding protein n=1 Tax=Brevundimonas sp. TaxID=1871086 RepID=UPI002733648F|nr:peptidoglycan-binding protein [Brevundimonas sp.]MDP3406569.1 peptidoglycan-binding protein [Brevundimonas sp.]